MTKDPKGCCLYPGSVCIERAGNNPNNYGDCTVCTSKKGDLCGSTSSVGYACCATPGAVCTPGGQGSAGVCSA